MRPDWPAGHISCARAGRRRRVPDASAVNDALRALAGIIRVSVARPASTASPPPEIAPRSA